MKKIVLAIALALAGFCHAHDVRIVVFADRTADVVISRPGPVDECFATVNSFNRANRIARLLRRGSIEQARRLATIASRR